jgi:toxin ParE1/3/4
MRVTWHRRARQDLRHLRAQIAEENPQAAQRMAQRILQAVELLAEQPGMDRASRVPDTREFVITGTPYIAGIVNLLHVDVFIGQEGGESPSVSLPTLPLAL